MKLFSKLEDRTAEQLVGGKNDKWQEIPDKFDNPATPEKPGFAPPGLSPEKFPKGLADRLKQPGGWPDADAEL